MKLLLRAVLISFALVAIFLWCAAGPLVDETPRMTPATCPGCTPVPASLNGEAP